jgi:hypothetical protein
LQRDVATTRARQRELLDALADRHGIARRDVTHAMHGYLDDLLADVVYARQREIEREIEAETAP